jgi:DNA-binding CsgD family transcriptional regulator
MGFINDAFQYSLIPPPPEDDVAYLDFDGHIVEAGARIKEIFNDFFGRDIVDGAKRNHNGTSDIFLKAYKRFLHGLLDVRMNKVLLKKAGNQYLFIFKPMKKNGLALKYSGFPYASVRFLEVSPMSLGARSTEQAGAFERFDFSRRELEVLNGIFKGQTNKEIAQALGVDESTIKRYTHNIYEKTGFKSRVELVLGLPGA